MKKLLHFLALAAMLCIPWVTQAQSVTIGTGTDQDYETPVNNYYNYSFVEMIYTADEIAAGNPTGEYILNLGFDLASNGLNNKTYTISVYMKHVDDDQFGSAAFTSVSSSDLVYQGSMTATSSGWVTLDLQTPFHYDGTSNLLIAVNKTAGSYAGYSYNWNHTSTSTSSTYMCLYKRNDSDGAYSISSLPSSPSMTYNRPNVQLTFGALPTCFRPQNLSATLTPGNGTIATLTWERNANGTEDEWVLEYGTASDFTGATSVNVTGGTPSKDLTSLTAEVTYYARVKPACDNSGTLWSDAISFKPTSTYPLTIFGSETGTSSYIPMYGNYFDDYTKSECIIPATELETMAGATIKSMTFYASSVGTNSSTWANTNQKVFLKEVNSTTLGGSYSGMDDATIVFDGLLDMPTTSSDGYTISFSQDYTYEGGNLLIGIYNDDDGSYNSVSWYGKTGLSSGVSAYGNNSSSLASVSYNAQTFLPRTTFSYLPNPTPKPRNLAYSNVSSSGATLTWEAPANVIPTGYEYQYKTSTAEWPTDWTSNGTNLTVTINTLTASTTYSFRVRAIYDGVGESDPIETTFTTLDNCAFPTNFAATTTPGQGTKATFTWVKGYDETQWVLQYATNNAFTEGLVEVTTGFATEGTTVTYNATSLTPETHYYARVKATCSATSSSSWSDVADFTTTNYVDYTFNEDATSSYSSSYIPFRGDYVAYQTNSQFIIPQTSLGDLAGGTVKKLTFYSTSTYANVAWGDASFKVYVAEVDNTTFASNPTSLDWSAMEEVYSGSLSVVNSQMVIELDQAFTYSGTKNLMIGFEKTAAGTNAAVAWIYKSASNTCAYSYNYSSPTGALSYSRSSYLPKLTFNYRPTATPRPIITEPVETTDVTATIAWTKPSDNVTGYKYQYKLASATEWPTSWTELNDANAVSVTVPNLTPNTSYDFQIKAVYAEGGSIPSSTSFATTCPAATAVPYSYGFETAPEFNCWEVTSSVSNGVKRPNSYAHVGNYSLVFYGTQLNEIEMPLFNQPTNTLRMEYWVRPEGYTDSRSGSFAIGYYNANDEFVALKTYEFNTTTGRYDDWESTVYIKQSIDFDVDADNDGTPDVPADAHIVFRQFNPTSNYYWMVDDVKVKVIPTCEDVNDVHYVSFTNHSATIAWTADAAQAAWQIAYKAGANFDPYNAEELATATIVDVTSNPYLFDKNLEAATTYYMYVRGNCTASSNGYGDWSDTYATFTTSAATPAPSNFVASNPASEKVYLVWNAGGGDYEESWELYYVASTTAPEAPTLTTEATKIVNVLPTTLAPYELTGLTAETKYYIWVRANHGTDGKSAWVALTNDFFGTIAACSAMDPVVSDITHHNATVTWDGESADDFTVNYRTAATLASDGLTENFESGAMPNGWTTEGPGTWTVGTGDYTDATGAHDGTYNAKINHGTTGNETYLITPNLDLSARSDLKVNLWYINREWSGDLDGFGVYYRVNGGAWNEIFATTTATTAWTEINEDLPTGAYAANCQFGFKFTDGYGYGVGIDDITIGTPSSIPAGSWQTQAATTTTADLTGLTAGTKYDLKVVPNCNEALESSTVQFTTLPANNKYFLTAGDWNTASNWMDEEMPTTTDNAIIRANATIPNGTVATAKNITFEGTPTPTLTLADGGQLIANNSVSLTVQKSATANSWMGISAPVFYGPTSSSEYYTATNIKDGTYDLLQYAEGSSTWQSQKTPSSMSQERGYIYRRADATTLTFTGSTHVGNQSANSLVTWSASDASLKGFNLIGNPYPHAIYYGAAIPTTYLAEGFYILQTNGTWRTVAGADINTTAIGVGEAIMVKASDAISPFMMTDVATAPTSSKAHTATLAFTVSNDEYSDVAYAMFSNGEGLPKMSHLNAEAPMLYIPTDEGRYAIAMMEESVESFPLNFNGYGEYTLSVNNSTAFGYLHLIDRATGRDIDLLRQSTYTFNANGSSDRFTVKLSPSMEENGRAIFVWQENGNVVVEGDGDLQVFDVMGRQLGTTHVDGTTTFSRGDLGMSHSGVYVLRLNGNSQKIVVK